MGRHRTADEKRAFGERAQALRAAGKSRRDIRSELGTGDALTSELLRGSALPSSLRRPQAKDDERKIAVQMRLSGRTYDDICNELGISKGSCSLWLRDLPNPQPTLPFEPSSEVGDRSDTDPGASQSNDRRTGARRLRTQGWLLKEIASHYGVSVKTAFVDTKGIPVPARARHGGDAAHVAMMSARRWEHHRRARDMAEQQRKLEAAREVGEVDDHTLLLLGAVAYWCEGTKSKPWRRRANFCFINSDPLLMRLFVRWLALVGVPPERWVVRLQIHETADVKAAEMYWRGILDLPDLSFAPATIKRHKPLTNRKNVGDTYHGCLSVYVRQGAHLLQQVEGWVVGALLGAGGRLPDST
ncbi:MAG: helix-turn-helix domain containing protein [Actinobacteria bacterium]|nr:helix-turn-helix domain containing protein [Actinomycetota bacterium]MBW3648801.1 helix-turn-helix domain containing protein [Actinomycetota bacterium]